MHSKEFTYTPGPDRNPSVLVTAENQHSLRGFNTNYMTKGQSTRIQNEWRRIENQPWKLTTKERVLIKRVGKPARDSFRHYRKDNIS